MRLEKSAKLAKELGFETYTTTLNISPHKDLEKLFKIGDKYAKLNDLEFLKIAFRKNK
jgi:predicted adenine nucleotide alpha hydrolase (AANH) superfamily ATPase